MHLDPISNDPGSLNNVDTAKTASKSPGPLRFRGW